MVDLQTFDVELSLSDAKACEEAAKKLAGLIKPHWNEDGITFEVFTVGITNKIFSAQVTDKDKLIFRVFGQNTEKVIDRPHELKSWAVLAERGLAAELFAKFRNGLICGYLPGKSLSTDQVRDPFIKKEICRAMGNMHNIPVDANAEPCVITKTWEFFNNFTLPFVEEDRQYIFDSYFRLQSLEDDITELVKYIKKSGEDIAFTHNDLLIHNILFDNETKKVSFIDYEYADTNYALFDIANHFSEYAGVDNPDYSLCPKTPEKEAFVRDYLQFRFGKVDTTVLKRMIENLPLFEAASHLFWAIWALVQSQNSLIEFDYLGYAIVRHKQYRNRLDKFTQL